MNMDVSSTILESHGCLTTATTRHYRYDAFTFTETNHQQPQTMHAVMIKPPMTQETTMMVMIMQTNDISPTQHKRDQLTVDRASLKQLTDKLKQRQL